MLSLTADWLWDHWLYRRNEEWHLFFLRAPRALGNPDLRHDHARLGHAVSTDMRSWRELPDALTPRSGTDFFDSRTIWTGSTLTLPDGGTRVFYTGTSTRHGSARQVVGWADSTDLLTFPRSPTMSGLSADPRWYATLAGGEECEDWRDPFVFHYDGEWHMVVAASAPNEGPTTRGILGHATSPDLTHWSVQPPLSEPGRWGQLEVPQVHVIEGTPTLVFSCGTSCQPEATRGSARVFLVPGQTPLGPWDFDAARSIARTDLYAGQVVDTDEGWVFTGFNDPPGAFAGTMPDPFALADVVAPCP